MNGEWINILKEMVFAYLEVLPARHLLLLAEKTTTYLGKMGGSPVKIRTGFLHRALLLTTGSSQLHREVFYTNRLASTHITIQRL